MNRAPEGYYDPYEDRSYMERENAMQTPNADLDKRQRLTEDEINRAIQAMALDLPDWHVTYQRTDRGTVRIIVDGPDGRRKVASAGG
jgi:hypothetical protein